MLRLESAKRWGKMCHSIGAVVCDGVEGNRFSIINTLGNEPLVIRGDDFELFHKVDQFVGVIPARAFATQCQFVATLPSYNH